MCRFPILCALMYPHTTTDAGFKLCVMYFEYTSLCDCREVKYDYGDRTMESALVIQNFQFEDLRREYNCSVKNERGFETRRAQLEEEGEEEINASVTDVWEETGPVFLPCPLPR